MATMDIDQRSEKSHELDLKYVEARHQETLIAKDEEVRRQKVQVALLREENGRLKHHASQLDGRIGVLATQYEDAQLKLDSLNQKCREQESQVRAQAREHASLRAELLSLSNTTQDSTKMLAKQLALERELSMLKPEIEHLRSQLAYQKDVLAEKLALERQLNTLEVELANEKRAAQRAAERQTSDEKDAVEDLKQQMEDLERKLAAEKRAREKTQRELDARSTENNDDKIQAATAALQSRVKELEKALDDEKRDSQAAKKALEVEVSEARGQIDAFELRVGDLKSKLREVREQLKNAHGSGGGGVAVPTKEGAPAKKAKTAAAKLKRKAEEPSGPELLLQTPGIGNEGRTKRPPKKRGFDSLTAVQKSTFSITPFLNKTSNPMDESPDPAPAPAAAAAEAAAAEEDAAAPAVGDESELPEDSIMGRRVSASDAAISSVDMAEAPAPPITAKAAGGDAPKRRGRPAKEKVLSDAAVSKKNSKAQAAEAEPATVSAAGAPAKKAPVVQASAIDDAPAPAPAAKPAAEAEPKKKKRKILGASSKAVFDGDDMGDLDDMVVARPIKPAAATASAAAGGAAKRPVKALGAAANKRTMLGGVRNAFGGGAGGGFSPLKRDRRGVNASFLA